MAARSPNAVELWQSYIASRATSSEEEAFRMYVGALSRNATSKEHGTSNALSTTSSIAFEDISCERLDEEAVGTLEAHCRTLVQQLSSPSLQNGVEVDENILMYTENISHILLFYGLCHGLGIPLQAHGILLPLPPVLANHNQRDRRELVSTMLALCASSHKLLRVVTSEGALRHLLVAMCYLLGFVHHVLDPGHRWKHLFIMDGSKDSPTHISQADIQDVPEELSQLFISVFKEPSLPPLCPTELSSMQMEMLHVIGAAATGLMGSAKLLVTPEVIKQLLALLHPSRNSGCGPMQALTIKVFIKVLHVLHCFMPKEEQVEVDTGVTLSNLFSVLPFWLQEEHKHSSPTFFILLLNSISLLVDSPTDSGQLKELFAELGCFEKLVESLKQLGRPASVELGTQLVCSLFRAFTAILKDSLKAKDSFKQHLEYTMLKELTSTLLAKPTEDILKELLNMALEVTESAECSSPLVCNADALGLCLEWLVDLPHSLQVWLSSRVLDLSSSSVYNKQQCCGARLASVAVQVLARSQEAGGFAEEIEDNLLRLIEGLGTHSIMGTELKDILVSLRPVKCGENLELPTYYFKLQYVLSALANKENGIQSLYYFELRQPNSQISISELHRWPKENAFSFHCWVSLDRSCADGDQRNMRRMLYSFYAGSTGFEAFFTKDLVLVVAVHSKKRGFQTISVKEPLSPQKWHAVCVTHSASKKPWGGKNETAVYIDEIQKAFSTDLRAPDLSADYKHCNIGFCQREADLSESLEAMADSPVAFGPAISLFGRISSVYIFSEVLQLQAVQLLYRNGPNNLSLFQPKYPDTEALISKLVLFFHPKACKGNICVDLSPSHTVEGAMEGVLVGEVYVTRDVQLVLSSLGGVEVFFPILEQAGLPLRQREICSININHVPRTTLNFEPWNNEHEAVTYFIRLMTSMLTKTSINEQVFFVVGGPATIGALLQKVPPSLLTVAAHSAIEKFVEKLSPDQPEQQTDLYSSLLFNYRIWSRADYSVQLSHSEYLSTLVSLKLDDYRRDFGVQFVLDIIREYYNPSVINPKLSTEEKYQIRKSLMSIISLYIRRDIMSDEVDAMLGFLSAMNDPTLLDEVLRFLLGLLTTPTHQNMLSTALWEKGVVFLVLIQTQDFGVRLTTLRILTQLNLKQGSVESGVVYNTLHSGAFAAAMCQNEQCLPSSIILALLDLCMVKKSDNQTGGISNFDVYLATLRLLRTASMSIRHTICQDFISILHLNSSHVAKLAESKGWERLLLWLLTPCKSDVDNQTEAESATSETYDVVMKTIGYILWHCIISEQSEGQTRKVCGQFMAALDLFATEQRLLVPVHLIKQRIFLLLMNAVALECSSVPSWSPENMLSSVILQLSQLLEAFIISSYPSFDVVEDLEVILQKFSHNGVLVLNKEHCSMQLLEQYWNMLRAAHVLEGPIEPALMQSVLRILLASACSDDAEYCQYGCKLQELQFLEAPDAVYVLRCIATQFSSDQPPTTRATLLQHLFQLYRNKELVPLPSYLPDLTNETIELVEYSKREEWHTWLGELQAIQMQYSEVVYKWLKVLSDHTRQCKQDCLKAEAKRKEIVFSDLEKYQITVSQQFYSQRELELSRQKTLDNQYRQELSATLQRWSGTRRFLIGECGAWKNRDPDLYLWKMDRTENFSRMRLKLARNYNYNKHTDASQHSSGETPLVSSTADTSLLAMATATKSPSEEEEEHLFDQIQKLARDEPAVALEKGKKEKLMIREMCQLVTVVEVISGTLDITNRCIYFVSDAQDKDAISWYLTDFTVKLNQIRELHLRRYNTSRTALEMFLLDQTNYFLNFPTKKILNKVCNCIVSLSTPNLNIFSTQEPAKLMQSSGLIQKWVKREITNFDYIMQLNTISGRTYNDLNQYPIFPWILRDYSCDTLDLSNSEVFRDLSKPMGIQNPDLEEKVQTKYEEFDDPVMGKFHYGTHYSNAATVIHYLIRLEPFTSLHINLQSGMFDHPDRQFFSIPNAWSNIYLGSDVKELIPEFFCLPDFLRNVNGYDLGVTQDKTVVGDVILPKWASSPEDFIRQHREALESEYVSAHLNEWIDLIFGYKQTGPEAEKAMNVFNKYSYQENVNLDNIQDPKSRREIESIITNFGQTPTRLFNERHPTRDPPVKSYRGYSSPFTGKRVIVNLFEQMQVVRKGDDQRGQTRDDLMANVVEVLPNDPIVFIGSPGMQSRALIVSGNPETLVTISQKGLLGIHGWLPFSNNKQRSFTFHPDTNTSSDRSKCPCLGGPFDKDLQVSSHMFALSSNNKLLLSAGHWDNSFRTYSLEKNKMVARTMHHTAVVTCMAVDRLGTEDLLITGSKDTTCVIWKFSKHDPPSRPQQTLYGHDAEVLCVDICSELDLAISGAKNGVCLVHTIRSGQLVHKLTPKKSCEIRHVAVSTTGVMVVYSVGSRSTGAAAVEPCLHLYSINGRLLEEKKLSKPLSSIVVEGKWIISGNELGVLTFRDLFSFKQHNALDLSASIRSISPVLDYQTKLCTHLLVGLHNGKLIIVSPKDSSVI